MNPTLFITVTILTFLTVAESATLKKCPVKDEQLPLPGDLESSPGEYNWVVKTPGVIPYKCLFVYGGGYKRLLYVGRVRVGGDVLPAPIHHYGQNTTESVHYQQNGQVQVARNISVEWLCAKGRVGWQRVADLSSSTIAKSAGIPIGYDRVNDTLLYGCLVHSFYSDSYPASLGTVVDGQCVFEVNGKLVNSGDFAFWHTLELLVSFPSGPSIQ